MPSRNSQTSYPAYVDGRQEAWHRRSKRLEKWLKVYSSSIGGIALLSLTVLTLAATSLAQKSQTVNALRGILAWNIVLVKYDLAPFFLASFCNFKLNCNSDTAK